MICFKILQSVWPHSGHYLPTEENFQEFVSFLNELNVDLTNVKVSSINKAWFPSVFCKVTHKGLAAIEVFLRNI